MRSGKSTIRYSLFILCIVIRPAWGQAPNNGGDQPIGNRGVARELGANEAAAVLNVPKDFLARLRSGEQGFEAGSDRKEKLTEGQLNTFAEQFGRLKNDLPTFQVGPDKYFVLIPLAELEKQPAEGRAPGAEGANNNIAAAATGGGAQPVVADHRFQQTPVRDQGHRGTCVAFAACAELESMLFRSDPGTSPDLCENLAYYWFMKEEQGEPCKDPGLPTFKAAGYLQNHLVGDEAYWPYVGKDPIDLAAQGNCDLVNKAPIAFQGKPGVGIDKFLLLPQSPEVTPDGSIDIRDTATLERLLNQDHDIVFGTIVAWNNAAAPGIIDVKLGPAGQPIFGAGGHAMLIVGYRKTGEANDPRPFFIVKNSWGAGYGHNGYLYLTYDYIRTYARYGYSTKTLRHGTIDLTK